MIVEETLEPIQPIEETPYGALVIHNDVLCTPTSLCTWSDAKPAVYCRLPPHTLNPVCQEVNKGIGLMGCYEDATCGGMVPVSKTQRLLEQNPQYKAILHAHEQKLGKEKKKASPQPFRWAYVLMIVVLVLLSLLTVALLGHQTYKVYKKRRHFKKKKLISQTPKRSAFRRILSGAGKTGRPSSR
jgi:hypothetical protein